VPSIAATASQGSPLTKHSSGETLYLQEVPEPISLDELQLATRNHGMPLEALRWDVTPIGLHYLLIHYDIPQVDPAAYRLEVDGLVTNPLSLSLDEIRERPSIECAVTLECAGNGRALLDPHVESQPWLLEAVGTARWRGIPVAGLLDEAGVEDGVAEIVFTGLDRGVEGDEEQVYARSLTLDELRESEAILAYEINGVPLPPQHGFPLRLVVPGWYGMTSVKWLARISAVAEPFAGYQMRRAYRLRETEDEEGTAVSWMRPRSLVIPPGIPDFATRKRFVPAGRCRLQGRAWSGLGEIESVAVSLDGGRSWSDGDVASDDLGRWAWRSWTFDWDAVIGEYELCSRARDAAGNEQPLGPTWNLGGYANNALQRVPVTVTP
jgi:sulfane dehydrogenase subunit SoxC